MNLQQNAIVVLQKTVLTHLSRSKHYLHKIKVKQKDLLPPSSKQIESLFSRISMTVRKRMKLKETEKIYKTRYKPLDNSF